MFMYKTKKHNTKDLEVMKRNLKNFDLAVPGTLRFIYTKCGKQNCACQTDEKARHGPYWLWDRKVNGKLSSKMVTKKMADKIKVWIKNRSNLENLVAEILVTSQDIAVNLVEESRKSEADKM